MTHSHDLIRITFMEDLLKRENKLVLKSKWFKAVFMACSCHVTHSLDNNIFKAQIVQLIITNKMENQVLIQMKR